MMRSYRTMSGIAAAALAVWLLFDFNVLALVAFPALVAWLWLRGNDAAAFAVLLCAVVSPVIALGSLTAGIAFGATASLGLLLGVLVRGNVSLGITVTVLTVAVFLLLAIPASLSWETLRVEWQAWLQQHLATMESAADESSQARVAAIVESLQWLGENLAFLYFGALFSGVLLMTTLLCSRVYARIPLTKIGMDATSRFCEMRTPEHLVWLAILLALCWFWDARWPNEPVRFVAWNGALVLATVYWLNGLSILFYLANGLSFRFFTPYLVLLIMLLLNVISLLGVVGFFDTWLDWRFKIAKFALRRLSYQNGDGGDGDGEEGGSPRP